jgi:hypothetical protein
LAMYNTMFGPRPPLERYVPGLFMSGQCDADVREGKRKATWTHCVAAEADIRSIEGTAYATYHFAKFAWSSREYGSGRKKKGSFN